MWYPRLARISQMILTDRVEKGISLLSQCNRFLTLRRETNLAAGAVGELAFRVPLLPFYSSNHLYISLESFLSLYDSSGNGRLKDIPLLARPVKSWVLSRVRF